VILKTAPPTVEELDLFKPDQLLISPLQMPVITEEFVFKLKSKRIVAMAMEYLQDDDGSYPVVRMMSEMAGISAMLTAAELLSNPQGGKGILLGGISGVPPAKVVILGAGVVAEFAARTALGLGVQVSVFDNNIYKLMRLQSLLGRNLYTSSLNPAYLQEELLKADVAIGAMHSKTGRTPVVVSEDMVRNMKPGSVIVDVSIDQGGCFETSEMTTHDQPTFEKHQVIHHCIPNIASRTSRTASVAISNIMTPILLKAGAASNWEGLLFAHPGLRNGIYCYRGAITNEYLAQKFGVKYANLDLLIMSNF
jgi:alanine dehydrogenase